MIVAQFFQLRTYFSLFFRVVAYQVIACMNFPCRKKRWTVCYRYIHRVEQQKQNLKWNVESPIGANIFSNVTQKKGSRFVFLVSPCYSLSICEFIQSVSLQLKLFRPIVFIEELKAALSLYFGRKALGYNHRKW